MSFEDYMELYNYIKKKLSKDKKNYVFIDEVQNVENFQKAVDGLYINKNVDKQEKMLDYFKYGSLPQTVQLFKADPNLINSYLDGIFSTVVYKDLMMRNNINNKLILESVLKYISAFLEAFLLYKVDRFDIKGKNVLSSGYKYYVVDLGFRHYLLGKKAG